MLPSEKIQEIIQESNYISRDLSWIQFNYRVLDQAKKERRSLLERLKFIAIAASNLDEFFMIRVGSLYNYLDYNKQRNDFSNLREEPFRQTLYAQCQEFKKNLYAYFMENLASKFAAQGFSILSDLSELSEQERERVRDYFQATIFPMLTPMVYDNHHTFPILMNKILVLGIVTKGRNENSSEANNRKASFVQIPQNLPRFFEIERNSGEIVFVPIELIIRNYLDMVFRNVEITSVTLFRITRNGDFSLEENDDLEVDVLQELKSKLKTRKTGRVVRLEIEQGNYSTWLLRLLKSRWDIDDANIFEIPHLLDLTGLWQIIKNKNLSLHTKKMPAAIEPLALRGQTEGDIFQKIKRRDLLLHHPYNSFEPVLQLLEEAAEDPDVLAIKITIYRLAKDSRITTALLRAAENGKNVAVLFEVKARFDEENNIREAQRLQQAGCFVIYGISNVKTHTKLMLIVRKEKDRVVRYVHMSSGNYNEDTARLYTDVGLLSTKEIYAQDISEFFNAITGHSIPEQYRQLITAPNLMRKKLIALIENEKNNALQGLPSGICIKINSLQDQAFCDALYSASQAGVPIELIVRGVCCLRPKRKGLSENIAVRSIVGDFLEHARLFYFHNAGEPLVYGGSADAMVRSFERRIESLFQIIDPQARQEAISILAYNLMDNQNSYLMEEDGTYHPIECSPDTEPFDVHRLFFEVSWEKIENISLYNLFKKVAPATPSVLSEAIQNGADLDL
jgi:polyphosphate kinase